MDQAKIEELLSEDTVRRRGLGIGFAYVMQMLRMYFGEQMSLQILSGENGGTTVAIILPIKSKEDFND